LTAEFTAAMSDRVRTFEDYLQLEDRLFIQLKEKVYAPTAAGPKYTIVRYSAGSAADPERRAPNWNRSFELAVDDPKGGALLLHGMSDSPYSLRALGEALHQRGYQVLGLRLPGHGTAPSGLTRVSWEDMAAAARLAMEHLAYEVGRKPIHIVGYSTGGPLALDYALNALEGTAGPTPASLILISPAIGIHPVAALASWKDRLAVLPGLERFAWMQIQPEFDPYKYNSFATNAGSQVHRLTRAVAGRIATRAQSRPEKVLPPTLVFKSAIDATVSTDAVVDRLLGRLAPHRHELVLFDINRFAVKSTLMVADPGLLTDRLMGEGDLPFSVTFVTNEDPDSTVVLGHTKPPFSTEVRTSFRLKLAWPPGVISLSHVALPFPPDDPLYGQRPPGNDDVLFLGQIAIQGERGLLQFPSDWLLRIRHNPFYDFLESRTIEWIDNANR
jgi:alpha-beta hydrolase superfamily lysophospholipase